MKALFILGPTGSGKTSSALAQYGTNKFSGIVNVDASQAYRQVSVGVAKPSPQELAAAPHYLFGIADCVPQSLNAAQYRALVEALLQSESFFNTRPPIFVGGTLFYAKSLFFKLCEVKISDSFELVSQEVGTSDWDYLKSIDPVRAENIHPHDTYRVSRALEIYRSTGCLPSSASPVYDPVFSDSLIIWIEIPDSLLKAQIYQRTCLMLSGGWIEEVEALMDTPWEEFAKEGFALGYDDVYSFIKAGKPQDKLESLKTVIASKTWTYARRQRMFWRSLKKALSLRPGVTIIECAPEEIAECAEAWLS